MPNGSKKTNAQNTEQKITPTSFKRLFRGNSTLAVADTASSTTTSALATSSSASSSSPPPITTTIQQQDTSPPIEKSKLDLSSSNAALMNSFADSKNPKDIQNFVLHLLRTPEITFSWGLYALDQAQQSNKWMATFLLETLFEKELLRLLDALLRQEQPERFCRGNQLAAKLIDAYLLKSEVQTFKTFIIQEALSEKMLGNDNKKVLPDVLKKLLDFQKFPAMMQKILGIAYLEIHSRTGISANDKTGLLLGMIFLKFICPVLSEKSLELETALGDKVRRIISGGMQSWASKGNAGNGATDDHAKIELFNQVPDTLRNKLHEQLEKNLNALNLTRHASFPEKMHDIEAAQMLAKELLETTHKWGHTEEQASLSKQLVRLSAVFRTPTSANAANERPLSFLTENPISLAELNRLQEQLEKNTSATATTTAALPTTETRALPPKPKTFSRNRASSTNIATSSNPTTTTLSYQP